MSFPPPPILCTPVMENTCPARPESSHHLYFSVWFSFPCPLPLALSSKQGQTHTHTPRSPKVTAEKPEISSDQEEQ